MWNTITSKTLDDLECEKMVIRRGDIFYADLRPVIGSEQGGVRPVFPYDEGKTAYPCKNK